MNDDLATVMTKLPEPPPPYSLKATVMARIAHEADLQSQEAEATPSLSRPRDWFVSLPILAGLAVVVAAVTAPWISEGTLPDLTSPRLGAITVSLIPESQIALVIGIGLLVYIAGLFAPLRRDARR